MQLQFCPTHPIIVARTQVALPEGAFIGSLPFTVDETQRFRVDALVLSAKILATAYVQMIELALKSEWREGQNEGARSGHLDIAMLQHAWSIVDQIYSIRLLLRSLAITGEELEAFMSVTNSAYLLRNRMDHLDQWIPNIVASKDNSRSLFGSLSYFVAGAAVGSPEVDVFAVTQHAEPIRPGEEVSSVRVPDAFRMPIGNFALSAARELLDLDAVVLTLGPVMVLTNTEIETSIRRQVAEKATELGIPESDLLLHHGAGFKVMLALKADAPPEQSTATKNNRPESSGT